MNKLRLPMLGRTVTEGVLLRWNKSCGDSIGEGEIIAEVTADKATLALEAPWTGVVRHQCAAPGDLVPVDGVLAVIGDAEAPLPAGIEDIRYPRADRTACLRFREALDRPEGEESAQPLSSMRRVIASRMTLSKTIAPHFYVQTGVDMSACMRLRADFKEQGARVSYNDMILKACALALRRYPQVAAAYTGAGYVRRDRMHVGFAVAVDDDGLLTPVIRDADRLPLPELSRAARDLAQRARDHRLLPDEYTGAVFTVSNLGIDQVESFSAIINPGESAILAVGRMANTPVAIKDTVAVRPMVRLTLSCDHRVIDGQLAGRFNTAIKRLLEDPQPMRAPASEAS